MPAADPDIAVLQLLAKVGLAVADHVADQVIREETEDLAAARPRTDARLHRLLLGGYLEVRTVAIDLTDASSPTDVGKIAGDVIFERAYYVTPKASLEYSLPPAPNIRESCLTHHFKTLDASHALQRNLRAQGYKILDSKLETELIREASAGKKFEGGSVELGKFPDAQLVVVPPDATDDAPAEAINIEYVSPKYTNEMIKAKVAGFAGARTVWAVPKNSPATAERVQRLTGQEPLGV